MDLCALAVGDPQKLVASLSAPLKACRSVEEACTLLTRALREECKSGPGAERSLVLSRVYLSLPFSSLDAGGADFARKTFNLSPKPSDLFLALVGTQGEREDWSSRKSSRGHRAIPLNRQTVTTVPMLARCFQQIGFDLDIVLSTDAGIHMQGVAKSFGLFHVEEAAGSPYIPAQKEFVLPHKVQSAVGCGTMLLNGAVSIFIGFSRHRIPKDGAVPLVNLMPAFWQQIQPLYRRGAIFAD